MDQSEFSTTPTRILIHDPADGAALGRMAPEQLDECNFLGLPEATRLAAEYARFRAALAEHVNVVTLAELLGDDPNFRAEADSNPMMFMRDSSITCPGRRPVYPADQGSAQPRGRSGDCRPRAGGPGLTRAVDFADANMWKAATSCGDGWGQAILMIGFGVRHHQGRRDRLATRIDPGSSRPDRWPVAPTTDLLISTPASPSCPIA